MTFKEAALTKLKRTIVQSLLNAVGLNKHFPYNVLFADSEYLGLLFQSIYVYQGYQKVCLFMGSFQKQDRAPKLMRILKDNV